MKPLLVVLALAQRLRDGIRDFGGNLHPSNHILEEGGNMVFAHEGAGPCWRRVSTFEDRLAGRTSAILTEERNVLYLRAAVRAHARRARRYVWRIGL